MHIARIVHALFVFSRRTRVISTLVASMLAPNSHILDIGAGDGTIDAKILSKRADVKITGLDVLKRKKTLIPVVVFNGKTIPYDDNSYDAVLLIDTLHHAKNPDELLKEAVRVAKKNIIIKDHNLGGFVSACILRLMDLIGNKAYHVASPHNYYTNDRWEKLFKSLGLHKEKIITKLRLYPFPFSLIFERSYHFIVKLRK